MICPCPFTYVTEPVQCSGYERRFWPGNTRSDSRCRHSFSTHVRGGGGGTRPSRIMPYRKHLTLIPHRKLPPYQIFTGLQDAYTTHLALNRSCPRCHFHGCSFQTQIRGIGITVYTSCTALAPAPCPCPRLCPLPTFPALPLLKPPVPAFCCFACNVSSFCAVSQPILLHIVLFT